ncbi:DUF4124 domain-containing protein [Xanthomonas perforans]|uniref:DUF4124 domain-containing protein n=1 Tax=Xanthomonas perforans TaxID=442694 RepID=UPI00062D6AF1|nr:DUF4124 domain-containing protein [Xanthomonas perforans]KLC11369.1 hypothetical protein XP420_00195 [Xanthomonas perforans]KLC60420.1 hypothetical protein GEV872_14380 [Xanthomonas perforans]KLC71614.1 hypothetical protein GEV893_01250 [Xanthomonas perforans]KLC75546.1 hypothetical protein GEV904_12260 [Xanthomonas perforans]KLC77347.1 hypothetical protein GEV909_05910 [Xanthomonas perforans]
MEARFAILLALAIAAPCHAQQVHKCRERGQVVYQSAPCASGQAEKVWDAAPAPEQSNAEQWRLYRIRKQLDSRYAADRSASAAAYVSGPQSSNACESAKAQRKQVYDAAGLHRSYEISSYWDNVVQNACK